MNDNHKEPTFNEWWLSLSEGQQKAWMQDKWMLADISFRKGIEIGKSITASWISVKERLPEKGEVIIAWDDLHGLVPFVQHLGENKWVSNYFQWSGLITHWMPLPPPPAKTEATV